MAKRSKRKSLAALAKRDNPFAEVDHLVRSLYAEKVETRFVEWKSTPPFGPTVTTKVKYRVVKAVLSFANTDGGFVVFGISPKGEWVGLNKVELEATDPAMLVELINGCASPEIIGLNYTMVKRSGRWFAVLHTPPSPLVPHVTTKEVVDAPPDRKILLAKGAVICRYGAKCDLATATQFSRMIEKRTAYLKSDLLRRIREVEVPTGAFRPVTQSANPTVLRMTGSSNASATSVRVTRDKRDASGILVYEELNSALFDEINNVLAAGKLLAPGADFVFDEKIYHRIYAERQHVTDASDQFRLARIAIVKFYTAMNYWASQLSSEQVADLLQVIPLSSKVSNMRMICRLAVLLGDDVLDWLADGLEKTWHDYAQPPGHLFLVRKMKAGRGEDPRLTALQLGEGAGIEVPGRSKAVTVKELLARPQDAATFLSRACMEIFNGDNDWRPNVRQLDILANGSALRALGSRVVKLLPKH